MLEDYMKDMTAFGSLVFALFAILVASLLGAPHLALQLFIALFICYLINFPMKIIFFKERPEKQKYSNILTKFDAGSFPSLHSMRAVSFAIILVVFANNVLFTLLMIVFAMSVLYTRITLKKHFFVDVVVGTILGLMIGIVVVHYDFASLLLASL